MSHGEVAAIGQWCLYQLVLDTQILKSIVEFGIGHVDAELLQRIILLRVKVEAHLTQPVKGLGVRHLVLDQVPCHSSLVDKLVDLQKKMRMSNLFPLTLSMISHYVTH